MKKLCVITGIAGDLGTSLNQVFSDKGFEIFGIDKTSPSVADKGKFYQADLNEIVSDKKKKDHLFDSINNWKGKSKINVLINNAAYQFVNTTHPIDVNEFNRTLNVNLIAPYILISHLAGDLEETKGSVINISSIHAKLTKPGFSFYASSKAGLSMLTKSLAIDYAGKFRVNCIEPAAINTKLLREGFNNDERKIDELKGYHPQHRIANPEEIANLAVKITESGIEFLHGSCIDMSGAISSRLHDPE